MDGPQGGPPPPIVGGPVGGPVRGPPFVGGNGQILPIGQCGRKGGNPLARVLDAESPENAAEFGEYPWMAAILRVDLSYVCGGALIDVNLVVTAAHCVAKYVYCQIVRYFWSVLTAKADASKCKTYKKPQKVWMFGNFPQKNCKYVIIFLAARQLSRKFFLAE